MTKLSLLLGIPVIITGMHALHGQALDNAEVRMPYNELKQLIIRGEPAAKPALPPKPVLPPPPKPALLSARLRFSFDNQRPVLDATFRVTSFSSVMELIPLMSGDVTLEKQEPKDALLVMTENSLCLTADSAGARTLQLRFLPVLNDNSFSLSLPPCPSMIFETGELTADRAVVLGFGDTQETLGANQIRPLPHSGRELTIRLLDVRETREALSPPEPSVWSWQHQALVRPADGELIYHIIARASAAEGSGVQALLPMPPDAQDIAATGEDLVSQTKIRGENHTLAISLAWKTRGVLDRVVTISYRIPLRPLDRSWHLQAPGGDGTRTRFIIASSPLLVYSAADLTGPLPPQGLPSAMTDLIKGSTCHHIEAGTSADLTITPVPVAPTAEGVVPTAEWALKIEQDGAMLVTGEIAIEHKGSLDFLFDTPEDLKLLSCDVSGKAVSPVDLGKGTLKITLPPPDGVSRVSCSFTGRTTALDPVEGTMKLSLPRIPLFIHSLHWRLDLPAVYQSETHGNLQRTPGTKGDPPSRISLRKNLCRDERPEIQVFYQRSDLNR